MDPSGTWVHFQAMVIAIAPMTIRKREGKLKADAVLLNSPPSPPFLGLGPSAGDTWLSKVPPVPPLGPPLVPPLLNVPPDPPFDPSWPPPLLKVEPEPPLKDNSLAGEVLHTVDPVWIWHPFFFEEILLKNLHDFDPKRPLNDPKQGYIHFK